MTTRAGRRLGAVVPLAASLVAGPSAAWRQLAGSAPAVAVETRAIPGRDVKQVIAQGRIDAPPHAVRAVIADLEVTTASSPLAAAIARAVPPVTPPPQVNPTISLRAPTATHDQATSVFVGRALVHL